MRRRTLTTALALAIPSAMLGTPAFAKGPGSSGGSGSTASKNWDAARTSALLATLPDLRGRRTSRGAEIAAQLEEERRIDAAGLSRAIDGSQYACAPTELTGFIRQQTKDWTAADFTILDNLAVLDWPTYQALLFEPSGPQYYGRTGEYTKELEKTFGKLQGFWDLDGSDIRMAAMHGEVIQDDAKMVATLTFAFEISEAEAQEIVDAVQEYLAQPKFDGGRNPLFTFNAFAYSDRTSGPGEGLGVPDKIIMGDGILEGMAAIGLGDVAPRGILAHEYGHQLQYRLGLFDDHARTPEATRETELEADALAGYYLSHPRGERLRTKRVEAFIRVDHEVGDCSFTSNGHHGTPDQRAAAGRWADALANEKGAKGHILPTREVSDRFRAALPQILAPTR